MRDNSNSPDLPGVGRPGCAPGVRRDVIEDDGIRNHIELLRLLDCRSHALYTQLHGILGA